MKEVMQLVWTNFGADLEVVEVDSKERNGKKELKN